MISIAILGLTIHLHQISQPSVGGSSFVELITGLNLGLMTFAQFKKVLDWLWNKLKGFITQQHLTFADAIQRHLESEQHLRGLESLQLYLSNYALNSVQKWHSRIWAGSATLAGISCLGGIICLYIDRYCPWNWLLAIPWPLYWVLSGIYYIQARYRLGKKINSHKETLNVFFGITSKLDDIEKKIK